MEIYLQRKFSALYPLYDSDEEAIKKLPIGQTIKAKISVPRNYQFHKKGFALLNLWFQNQDHFDNFEHFRFAATIKAGFCEVIYTSNGEQLFIPRSLSFSKMDESEFSEVFNRFLDLVCKELDTDNETILNELKSFF